FSPDVRPSTPETAVLGQWVERAASLDMLAAVPAALRPRLDPFVAREPGVVGYGLPGLPSTMLNRVFIGGEPAEPAQPSPEAVTRVLERFAQRGASNFFAHVASAAAAPALLAALSARGVERYPRAWLKLAREPGPLPEPELACELAVREAVLADSAAFAELVIGSHGTAPEAAPLLAALVTRPRWHMYLACQGSRPVATGALMVLGDVGYLGFAATDPAYRRRGAQRALLAKRMRMAFALGCRWVFSDTGEAVAGQANPSFDNMRRLGLAPIARRENYAPAGTRWS
ncbi:MAG TPA: GNAT family N-acetyltransferase, partial [Polyangiales bacterium]|nr:GNAT family N-acetyltransferase [Polyangiales bacterium]